jgi:hypothetical protein
MKTHPILTKKIPYSELNSRQKENYNFQKISGLLADYGFTTIRLSDDWNGADFLAQHMDGKTVLRVQLKGRLGLYDKYLRKGLWMAFPNEGNWYLCPHDKMHKHFLRTKNIRNTASYRERRGWSYHSLPRDVGRYIQPFVLK